MVSLKNKKGFTIVELLMVIVVICILATLVIVTFTGIRQKGNNTQRTTDIKALNGYIESFYAEYDYYPTIADMKSPGFVKTYMKGLDRAALVDPKQDQALVTSTTGTGINALSSDGYGYTYTPGADAGGTCSAAATNLTSPTDTGCSNYTIKTAKMEGSAKIVEKGSN